MTGLVLFIVLLGAFDDGKLEFSPYARPVGAVWKGRWVVVPPPEPDYELEEWLYTQVGIPFGG